MYGASIEKDFQHNKIENEQLKRRLEMLRLLETDQPQLQHSRRSLTTILGRITPRFAVRTPGKRSPVTSS